MLVDRCGVGRPRPLVDRPDEHHDENRDTQAQERETDTRFVHVEPLARMPTAPPIATIITATPRFHSSTMIVASRSWNSETAVAVSAATARLPMRVTAV